MGRTPSARKKIHKGFDYFEDQLEEIKKLSVQHEISMVDVLRGILDHALGLPKNRLVKSADHLSFFVADEQLHEKYKTLRDAFKTRYLFDVPGFGDTDDCDEETLREKLIEAGYIDIEQYG